MTKDFNEFVAGAIIMAKEGIVGETHKKDRCLTPRHSMLFLTSTKVYSDNKVLLTCIFDGNFVDYYVEKSNLQKEFQVIKMPTITDLDPVDQWLTDYYNVHGKVFFIKSYRTTMTANMGPYKEKDFAFGQQRKSDRKSK